MCGIVTLQWQCLPLKSKYIKKPIYLQTAATACPLDVPAATLRSLRSLRSWPAGLPGRPPRTFHARRRTDFFTHGRRVRPPEMAAARAKEMPTHVWFWRACPSSKFDDPSFRMEIYHNISVGLDEISSLLVSSTQTGAEIGQSCKVICSIASNTTETSHSLVQQW